MELISCRNTQNYRGRRIQPEKMNYFNKDVAKTFMKS